MKTCITFLCFFSFYLSYGQSTEKDYKYDISFAYRKSDYSYSWFDKYNNFTVQVRRKIGTHYYVRAALSSYETVINLQHEAIIEINDSTRIVRDSYGTGEGFQFKIGSSYAFSKYFNIGLNLIAGHGELNSYFYDEGFTFDSFNNYWLSNSETIQSYHEIDEIYTYSRRKAATFQQNMFGVGMDAEVVYPFLKRFEVGLRHNFDFRYFQISDKEIHYTKDDHIVTEIDNYWEIDKYVYLLLRCKF